MYICIQYHSSCPTLSIVIFMNSDSNLLFQLLLIPSRWKFLLPYFTNFTEYVMVGRGQQLISDIKIIHVPEVKDLQSSSHSWQTLLLADTCMLQCLPLVRPRTRSLLPPPHHDQQLVILSDIVINSFYLVWNLVSLYFFDGNI